MQSRPPRFSIRRPADYRVRVPGGRIEGRGYTINISRRGVLLETGRHIDVGRRIDMEVDVGDAVGSGAPIKLLIQGVTLRNQQGAVAVSVKKFRVESDSEEAQRLFN